MKVDIYLHMATIHQQLKLLLFPGISYKPITFEFPDGNNEDLDGICKFEGKFDCIRTPENEKKIRSFKELINKQILIYLDAEKLKDSTNDKVVKYMEYYELKFAYLHEKIDYIVHTIFYISIKNL